MPTTPCEYLSSDADGRGSRAATSASASWTAVARRQQRAEADVDEVHLPGVAAALPHDQAELDRAERDGVHGGEGHALDRSGVGVDPAGDVDRDRHPRALAGGAGERRGVRTQSTAAPDAEHPVDDQVGPVEPRVRGSGPGHPSARAAEGGEAGRMGAPGLEQDGRHPRPAAGESGTGEECVAPVVAGTHQQRDPAAVRRGEQAQADRGETRRGTVHQRALGGRRQHRLLGRADLRRGEQAPHGSSARGKPSATTTAEAMPPS